MQINHLPDPEVLNHRRKETRDRLVSKIVVTTNSGKSFDGDEKSQERMARAAILGNPGEETFWVLADNTNALVTYEELKEAARLAGQAQTEIWADFSPI